MTIEEARSLVAEYRKFLRIMRRKKIDIGLAPPEVQDAMFNLHQLAIAVFWLDQEKCSPFFKEAMKGVYYCEGEDDGSNHT